VNISIPKQLYDEITREICGSGFSSPSEWIKFILRQAISSSKKGQGNIVFMPYLGSKNDQLLKKGLNE